MKTYYSIEYAARKWHLDEDEIRQLIEHGEIETIRIETDKGDVTAVLDDDIRSIVADRIDRSQFAHLEGNPISISVAARKYGFTTTSLSTWARQGHIRVLGKDGRRILLDESDVAYARKRADVKDLKAGKKLF